MDAREGDSWSAPISLTSLVQLIASRLDSDSNVDADEIACPGDKLGLMVFKTAFVLVVSELETAAKPPGNSPRMSPATLTRQNLFARFVPDGFLAAEVSQS